VYLPWLNVAYARHNFFGKVVLTGKYLGFTVVAEFVTTVLCFGLMKGRGNYLEEGLRPS
jgi:hypothetical protein